jgi:Family of unknown function (DUF695)
MTNKILIIITVTIFSDFFGCHSQSEKNEKKSEVFPKEEFYVFQGEQDGKPVIGSFNLAYKSFDKKAEFPWCLKLAIGLDLDSVFDNGLPKDGESKIANKLEDELLADIRKLTTAHYVGHLFDDTFLDVYIYVDDPKKIHDFLQTQINKVGLIRGFGYEINNDPGWTTVKPFLK